MAYQNHFSGHAAAYAAARPTYPDALFTWLADQCQQHELAWDAGCGNGQASLALAHRFQRVHASDSSEEQIGAAPDDARITWRVESAEHCSLRSHSVDLVTVAQAFHWFDQISFAAEATRVLKPGGVVAVWCYGLSRVTAAVDDVFHELYEARLGAYWPPERRHVETGYRALPFPFEPINDAPRFSMRQEWTLAQYLAYLQSWSASQRHLHDTGRDAVQELARDFGRAWGAADHVREVTWPMSLRAGRTASE